MNAAKFRNGVDVEPASRWLFPYASDEFTADERQQIDVFAKQFKPEWLPVADKFGPWHYMVISKDSWTTIEPYCRPVVILMDSHNFSASDIFLAAFKDCSSIKLIGTPSCGGSGYSRPYTLAHSNIEVKLSSMVSFRVNGYLYDGRGVAPDILIWPTPEDVIGKTDSVLDRAIEELQVQTAI